MNFAKNTLLHVIFSTLFLVFGYPDEMLSLGFDILHQVCPLISLNRLQIHNDIRYIQKRVLVVLMVQSQQLSPDILSTEIKSYPYPQFE